MPNPLSTDPRWSKFIRQVRWQALPTLLLVVFFTAWASEDSGPFWDVVLEAARIIAIVVFLLLMARLYILHRSMKNDAGR